MSLFTWEEITVPTPFYYPGPDFAEALGINPGGNTVVGTFGLRVLSGAPLLGGEFHGFVNYRGNNRLGSCDYPENPGGSTSSVGVNDNGDIVGFYVDKTRSNEQHSYVWLRGARAPFDLDVPFAAFSTDLTTEHTGAYGINNEGFVVGMYAPRDSPNSGFVWRTDKIWSSFVHVDINDFAPVNNRVDSTRVRGINSLGDIVGSFQRKGKNVGFKWKVDIDAWKLDPDIKLALVGEPEIIEIVNVPHPRFSTALNRQSRDTTVTGINDNGWIVGNYSIPGPRPDSSPGPTYHGFVWKPEADNSYLVGNHITIDILGA